MLRIFVEGTTDIKFLKDLVRYEFGQTINDEIIIHIGGWGNLFGETNLNILRLVADQEGASLVIFDADGDEDEEMTCEQKRQHILEKSNEHSVSFDLFLYPNNIDSGDREALLQKIANPLVFKPFYDCFKAYYECLREYDNQYKVRTGIVLKLLSKRPERKVSLFNYLKFHGQESGENKRDYADEAYWNLNSDSLIPLKDFLRPHFS
jgi:hypothetical protein